MKIGYKLLAVDYGSRTTHYDRLFYPPTGEWVEGDIFVATKPRAAGVHLPGSLPGVWLATVEYGSREYVREHIFKTDRVRVLEIERWSGSDAYRAAEIREYITSFRAPSRLRTAIRRVADVYWSCPVVLSADDSPPSLRGESYYWTTPSGELVHHPSAYIAAFGRPTYMSSTHRVCVGTQWLLRHGLCPDAVYY